MKTVQGQATMEYILVIGIIVLAMSTMTTFIQRGTQGMVKFVADQVGRQEDSEVLSKVDRGRDAYSEGTNIISRGIKDTVSQDIRGNMIYTYNDLSQKQQRSVTLSGFTADN